MATQRRSSVLRFQLEGVEGPGVEIGRGSYAVVEEYDFQGLSCVGKSIHQNLYDNASIRERETILERFEGECEMLSQLRHPHIVQFLGVHFNEGSPVPVLVMERLHSTLAACIDRYGKLPDECCYSVLRDVGVGLRYLHGHTPSPIVHRDLTANNVLLTPDLTAKISDLGVAKILNLSPARMTQMTTCPGTPSYMSPEALVARPIYSAKMDIFAYGNLMTHVFCGRWPLPGEAFCAKPRDPNMMLPRTEVQRRDEYLKDIGDAHPLMGMMRRCLSNNPTTRPNVFEILQRIKEVMPRFPTSFKSRVDHLLRVEADAKTIEADAKRIQTLSDENAALRKAGLSVAVVPMKPKKKQISEPKLLQLKWRRTADLPLAMHRPHIVQINNTTYCGGGQAGSKGVCRRVFQYNDGRNKWTALPLCPTAYHALVELNEKLISIGGIEHDVPGGIPTNSVYVLEDLQWRKTMPPLATARCLASAITYDSHAIVCGGITSYTSSSQFTCTSTVEVYSSDTNQWTMSSPLPFANRSMSTAIVNDICYAIGGEDQEGVDHVAACAPLPMLIRSAEGHQAGTSHPSPSSAVWEVLPDCPLYGSTAAKLGGCVLALGGMQPGDSTDGSTDIHLYSPSSNCWRRVTEAKLPIASYAATTTNLPSGDIMLIGGLEKPRSRLNTVYIASIHSTSQ